MTALMTLLQLPSPTTAATMVRVKDARHLTHHSSGSNKSDSDENTDFYNESESSNNVGDVVEIIMKNSGGPATHSSRRTRKTKRHSDDFYLLHHKDESTTDLEWVNPCSGVFELSGEANSVNPPPSYYLSKLRKATGIEFHTVSDTMQTIDISDMATWSKYRRYYSFLPKISLDSNISLKRWYRHMQTYVATFAYLGRMQYKWDRTKRMITSATTHELNQLLLSARSILCEIETTINGSYPYPRNQPKLAEVTRAEMNKKLKFLTKRHFEEQPDESVEPEMRDLKFAKSKYYQYLRRMWRVIRMKSKRNGQKRISLGLSNESVASFSFSATLEDLVDGDINNLQSHQSSSVSSSESFQVSIENKRQHKKQRKISQKSAERPRQ